MTNILAIDVRDYGAVPDAVHLTDGTCSGTAVSSPTANWQVGDAGKIIKITNNNTSDGIFLGTILTVTDPNNIVLDASVISPVTGTANIYYGTDNATNLQAAFDAAYALIKTPDVKIKVWGPANSDGGGYLFATPLTSDCLDLDFEAPLYSAVGLGTGDLTTAWVLGNSDITNIRLDVSGGCGVEWGKTGFHNLYLHKLEINNAGFSGQSNLTGHGFGFNIIGAATINNGTIGFNFNDCQDIHGPGVLNAIGVAFALGLNGSEDVQINLVADTVGTAAFLIDAAHNVVLNCNTFVNGTNTASTGKIGSVSTTPSSGIVINLLAQASGGPALYVDYCNGGVQINITATNRPLNSRIHNDITYAVQYGTHNSGTLDVNVTRDSDIALFTGTQFGNLTDKCSGVTTDYSYLKKPWTPVDLSGGGLTLTTTYSKYTKVGDTVFIQGNITFPTTSDTHAVAIGGLPLSVATGSTPTFAIGTNANIAAYGVFGSSGVFFVLLATIGSAPITNAQMSGKYLHFSGFYHI